MEYCLGSASDIVEGKDHLWHGICKKEWGVGVHSVLVYSACHLDQLLGQCLY